MTQNKHVFLCPIQPRYADYVTVSKYEVLHLDAGRGYEYLQFFELRDYCVHSPIVTLRQIPPHGVETEFGQAPVRSVIPHCFLL